MNPRELAFGVLGPLEVRVAGEPVVIGSSRQQIILALMLLEPGRVVQAERFIDAIWDADPPATAWVQVQIGVSKLRARLGQLGLRDAIATHEAGYLIRVPADSLDVARFRALVTRGRAAMRRQEPAVAAADLRAALQLWRGDALAGLPGRLVRALAARLDEERLAATEERVELDLVLGHHRDVIGELRELVAAQPLRERLYGQLMRALYQDGRQAEALEVYRSAQRALVDGHGLDPGEELRALERAILEQDPSIGVRGAGSGPPLEQAVPHQLPTAPRGFVGRSEDIDRIRRRLTESSAARPPVIVISGPPGVGKTALALHCAYEVADRFADGRLYAHLRDSNRRPVSPERVLDQFLRALGIAPNVLPTELDELATMFRSRITDRQVLVLLDDAIASWQVEPLISPYGCVLVVTSRGTLPGLRGADRIDLGVLEPDTSRRLLATVIGDERVRAEPEAVAAVAAACGHLPLALQVAAAKLEVRPHWRVGRLASRLADENRRLDELSLERAGVRASLSVSFEAVSPPARRLLPLLGGLGAADFAGWVAGPLLALGSDEGDDVLEELVDARLVEAQAASGHRTRYRLHELVGAFAREVLATDVPAAARRDAQLRLLRCWAFIAREAHRREYGGDFTIVSSDAAPWPLPTVVVDELVADPIVWFESERSNLLAALRRAAELGHHDLCADLAVTSVTLFENRAYLNDWRVSHELALDVARRCHDPLAEAALRCSRAGLALVEHRLAEAVPDLEWALTRFAQAGDWHGRGLTLRSLAAVDRLQGRHEQAQQRYEAALTDLRAVGDRAAEAQVLTNLGQIHTGEGRLRAADDLLSQALEICTETGERRGEAQVRHRLGELYLASGDLKQAETEFVVVRGMVGRTGDLVGMAYALLGLGTVRLARDDPDGAERALTDALEQARQAANRLLEGRTLLALAELAVRRGARSVASERLDEADKLFRVIDVPGWRESVNQMRRRLTEQ